MPKLIHHCPFCGSAVYVKTTLDGLLFTCQNIRRCGAVIRFESDHFAEHPEDAMLAFARSSPRGRFMEGLTRRYENGGR